MYAEVKFGPGYFVVGQGPNGFGLPFSAWDYPTAQFRYFYTPTKNWLHLFMYEKLASVGVTNNPVTGAPVTNPWSDSDYMRYNYNIYYFGDKWEAGGMFLFDQDKAARGATGTTNQWFIPEAFVKATFGPLYVEAQINYAWGQIGTPDSGVVADHLNINSYQWYGKAQYTMGPVYFGGQYSYTSGQKADDPGTVRAFLTTGRDYKPCLILINPDRDKYIGPLGAPGIGPGMGINNNYWGSANAPNTSGSGSTNFSLYQVFGGFKPVPKLDVYGSFTYANINEKPTGWVSDNLGYEVDITATYKLYDNVSYMVGFGYLFTGDAWKGTLSSASTSNDWLLMHKLTINFRQFAAPGFEFQNPGGNPRGFLFGEKGKNSSPEIIGGLPCREPYRNFLTESFENDTKIMSERDAIKPCDTGPGSFASPAFFWSWICRFMTMNV